MIINRLTLIPIVSIHSVMMLPLPAGSKTAAPSTLQVDPEQLLVGTVKGTPVSIRMTAAGPKTLFLNPITAERLSLRGGI